VAPSVSDPKKQDGSPLFFPPGLFRRLELLFAVEEAERADRELSRLLSPPLFPLFPFSRGLLTPGKRKGSRVLPPLLFFFPLSPPVKIQPDILP